MSQSDYVERAREARERSCVLKIHVLRIRSGEWNSPIFIFEGITDIGPYETWIKRIDDGFSYKGLPANGKKQVLEFWQSIKDSDDENFNSIYYFVDHDYDKLRGLPPSDNIFCTDTYSFENYLVTDSVLESVLHDELGCSADHESVQSALKLYNNVSSEFCSAMSEVNLRLFIAAKYGIKRGRIEKKVSKFVELAIDSARKTYNLDELSTLIPLSQEPTEEQAAAASKEFNEISDTMKSHRGKYIQSFFMSWLDILAEARNQGTLPFKEPQKIKYNRASISDRSLASRSEIPDGLTSFILTISGIGKT